MKYAVIDFMNSCFEMMHHKPQNNQFMQLAQKNMKSRSVYSSANNALLTLFKKSLRVQ